MSKRIVLLQALAAMPRDVAWLVAGIDDGQACHPSASDERSVIDILNHLVNVEIRYQPRLRRVVREERPRVAHIGSNERAHDAAASLSALLREFSKTRAATIDFLRELSLEDWQRPAVHETLGETHLRFLVQDLVDHDADHLIQLAEARRRLSLKPASEAQPAIVETEPLDMLSDVGESG